jgi:hypothetical protein
MSFDTTRGETVCFGGTPPWSGVLSDTWAWNGDAWRLGRPERRPPARFQHAMAYDSARDRTVLFGGFVTGTVPAGDTWEWDGAQWEQRPSAIGPAARVRHALAYDSARRRVVLFGGSNPADTWEWDGVQWTKPTPAVSPSGRVWHALAYDSVRRRTVLFGGEDYSARRLTDTWEWDGVTWTPRAPVTSPPASTGHTMGFDPVRGKVVLCRGDGASDVEVWEWDGVDWTRRATRSSPGVQLGHAAAYDTRRGQFVLYGGDFSIWHYAVPCDVVGPGHATGGLPLTCTSQPVIGTSFCLSFPSSLGLGFMSIGAAPVLRPPRVLDLSVLCSRAFLHADPLLVLPVAGSPAAPCYPLPSEPTLVGLGLGLQGFAMVVEGSHHERACMRATAGIVVTLQRP